MTSTTMASHSGPPAKMSSIEAPSPTLFLTNVTDKLRKPDLRLSLYTLFSTYGAVLDVVAMPGDKMRGKAHVVFRDVQTSTQAMRALQGFEFFGKELKIQYAKVRSAIFQKLEGVYVPPNAPTEAATDARQSLFTAPLPSAGGTAPSAGLPSKPGNSVTNGISPAEAAPQGTKRPREDESDEEEAPMEEDEDVPMEASSDEE